MRLVDIESHLRQYIPQELSYFNDFVSATYSVSSGVATITTVADHGLTAGDEVTIKDVVFNNPISSLTQSDGIAVASTQYPNDLTYPFNESVTISGADQAGYNGEKTIIDIADRISFTFEVDDATVSPATGSPVLEESNLLRYNSLFTVQSTPTTKTFTVNVYDVADFNTTCNYAPMANVRIAVDVSSEHALEAYSKQSTGDMWLFIIPQPTTVSKDRNTGTDFIYEITNGIEIHQSLNEQFSILVIGKATNNLPPAELIDVCRIYVRNALIKSLVGYFPSTELTTETRGIHYEGDAPFTYNGAAYAHAYEFGMAFDLNQNDTFVPQSRAVEHIQVNYTGTHPDTVDTDNYIAVDKIDYHP